MRAPPGAPAYPRPVALQPHPRLGVARLPPACTPPLRPPAGFPGQLRKTGHGFGPDSARAEGRKLSNCTPAGTSVTGCVGPFAFAKGPLFLMSQAAVRSVVASAAFAAGLAKAEALPPVRYDKGG